MFFIKSLRESREIRDPWLSTIGSLPFFELRRTSLASARVVPAGAVTRSVAITAVTGSSGFLWNWMSLLVTMPRSFEWRVPFSADGTR